MAAAVRSSIARVACFSSATRRRTSTSRGASSIRVRPDGSGRHQWLPLPHLLMLPLVRDDRMWPTGFAGAFPPPRWRSPPCFCSPPCAGFSEHPWPHGRPRRVSAESEHALYRVDPHDGAGVFRLALRTAYTSRCGSRKRTDGARCGAAVARCAGTLTRYEGWVLLPLSRSISGSGSGESGWPPHFSSSSRPGPVAVAGAQPVLLRRRAVLLSRAVFGAGDSGQTPIPGQETGGRQPNIT